MRLAEAGCKLVLMARRGDRLDALASQLRATYNVSVHVVVMDVRDTQHIMALPNELPEEFSKVLF